MKVNRLLSLLLVIKGSKSQAVVCFKVLNGDFLNNMPTYMVDFPRPGHIC